MNSGILAKKIDWESLEKGFAPLYGKVGRPSIPIRTIVGLLLLKQMYNFGDEMVVERYLENPYWQHFCREVYFQYKLPFDPSDFVHFRTRIGEEGIKKIFKQSIDLFGEENVRREVKEVRIDTTVQEKNITFPTDLKLTVKVIEHCKTDREKERYKTKAHIWKRDTEVKNSVAICKETKEHEEAQKSTDKASHDSI